ncbi:MAG TPA: hypothetical protein PLS49_00195, partial [Candidatus Woesebacteria bacterium]|nr:hypothetical protein [Candidatus Woesebacteria bacterium]
IVQQFLPFKSFTTRLLFACVIGIVLWAVQGYLFGYLQIRFMSYLYILVFFVLFIKQWQDFVHRMRVFRGTFKKVDKIAVVLILVGVIVQTFPIFGSGMRYADGVRFFHVNATDGILHLGYIQSMIKSFPPQEPGINASLVNYHYWSDLVIAEFARVWNQPVIHLFFQYFVPVISLLTGVAVYLLVRTWGGSKNVARWALFLLFFAGDAAYLIMFILHQRISFSSPAIDNGLLQFLNMPHAMAKMIFITSLISLYYWVKTKSALFGTVTVGLFSVLVGFKVYYGIFVAIALLWMGVYMVVKSIVQNLKKRGIVKGVLLGIWDQKYLAMLILAFALIGAAIYFPPNKASGGLFYAPLEWPKLFLGAGALEFEEWWLRRQVYEQAHNIKALFLYDSIAVLITLISVYGTRLLGILPTRGLAKKLGPELLLFFIPTVIIFNILGLYTLQESGLFNVYNFFVVSSIILTLFAAFWLAEVQKIKKVGVVLCGLFVLFTVPRVYVEGKILFTQYTTEINRSRLISNSELEALEFVRSNTDSNDIIQTHVRNSWDQVTPYSIYFANRSSYMTGTELLETHNQPIKEREVNLEYLFKSPNSGEFAQNMKKFNIDYVILKKDNDQTLPFLIERPFLEIEFENSEYIVVKDISK